MTPEQQQNKGVEFAVIDLYSKIKTMWVPVVYACNPSYLGD
jgi:hypothetical protein